MPQSANPLTLAEARVLACLVEKEKTTPDAYPLTLNGLTAACDQKTSRDPVMFLSESEVQAALETLRDRELVSDSFGASGRVLRWSHHFTQGYKVPSACVPLLAVLMLRGPQTVSELRANCERLYSFADASSVEAYLEELAARPAGALARKLARQPGAREQRWTHLLCGEEGLVAESVAGGATGHGSALEERVAALEKEVAELRAALLTVQGRGD